MKYLYGDATPFPIEGNFIETLVAATDACVALLRLDAAAEKTRREAQRARIDATAQIAELDNMAKAVHSALARHLTTGKVETSTQAAAKRISQSMDGVLKQTRAAIVRKRDAEVRKTGLSHTSDALVEVLGEFLRHNQLPDTVWRLRWKGHVGDEPVKAHVNGTAKIGLRTVFEVNAPDDHPWTKAVRVERLAPGSRIMLQSTRSWLRGGTKLREENLDKYWVSEVELSPERRALVLSKSAKPSDGRLELVFSAAGQIEPTLRRLDAEDDTDAHPMQLSPADQDVVERLWNAVEETISDLLLHRGGLILATLDGRPVRELERPADLAELILEAIGPLTREMRRRSRVPGEITLKRELGDGRREELFIPKERLSAKFAGLSDSHRRMFDIFGLEGTAEVVTTERPRDFPLSSASGKGKPVARIARGTKEPPPTPVKPDATLRLITANTPN